MRRRLFDARRPWLAGAVVVVLTATGIVPTAAAIGGEAAAAAAAAESGTPGPDAVTAFGTAATAAAGTTLPDPSSPIVGIAATPSGDGYWVATADGGVFGFGDAAAEGSLAGTHLNAPIVGIAPTPNGHGYWLAAADGGIFTFGNATFQGSLGSKHLNAPIVGIAPTHNGHGYWLAAADGGIFTFGNATFQGSLGSKHLNAPIVGIAPTPNGHGYWLAAADGGIFTFGNATFQGSLGSKHLNAPIVGIAPTHNGHGYWLAAADGGIFTFGSGTPFEGSDGGAPHPTPAVGIAGRTGGYWIAYGDDLGAGMISAIANYVNTRTDNVTVAVEDLHTGRFFQYRPGVIEHTASTLKVDILATLLNQAQAEGRGLTPGEQSLAVPMIEESLDSAADALWVQLGPGLVGAFERAAGMTSTNPATDGIWGTTTTTALDRLDMIRALVEPNALLTPASQAYVLNLMEHITPSQDWGATGGVPAATTVALKNGFAIINGWQINTTGWVDGGGRDYLLAVLTDGNASEAYGIATVNAVSALVWQSLGVG